MSATIERHVRRVGGICMQYREAGMANTRADTPTLVLLHASPRSSAMFEPWMQTLSLNWRVLAIDTPGYGGSDPLVTAPTRLADYLPPLRELLQAVAGPRFVMYGSATGAQLGIAYANTHPGDVQHLLLDNAAHFDDAERAHVLSRYFPDLSPRADGSHLLVAWQMATQMVQYFPWYEDNEAHRVSSRVPSAAEVHAAITELISAGPGYAAAYRAAFEHERAEHVLALRVPATLFRWQASILLKHIDRLMSFKLPGLVRCIETPADPVGRYAVMTAHLLALRDVTSH